MRVYIAAHHPDPANELAAALTAAGHAVVSTWYTPDRAERPTTPAGWRDAADRNATEIANLTDVLVLIAGPDRYAGGKFVEAGYAAGLGCRVVTVGGVENGPLHAAEFEHAADATGLIALLAPETP